MIVAGETHMARRARAGREAGFTLMEILIAMTILMVGLIPMLAVFRTALFNLNRSIEDTYAAAIAQSVLDAIRLGLTEQKVELADGTKFFIFDHDGSEHMTPDRRGILLTADLANPANAQALLARDYAILLPNMTTDREASTVGGTEVGRKLLYPRKTAGGTTRPYAEYNSERIVGSDGVAIVSRRVKVEKVYQLGATLKNSTLAIEQTDSYQQYGFAFTIQAAKSQDPNNPTPLLRNQRLTSGLYQVTIMIYRNFAPAAGSKRNQPVGGREFVSYVAE